MPSWFNGNKLWKVHVEIQTQSSHQKMLRYKDIFILATRVPRSHVELDRWELRHVLNLR